MGRIKAVLLVATCVSVPLMAQFKKQVDSRPSVSESLVRAESSNLLFGWFDPNRFSMHQSYSLSYMTAGGQGMSLGVLTSSMFYKLSDPLDVQFDVSLQHSPFSSFGNSKSLSGIYLSRAQLNYRPAENMLLQIQYRQLPSLYWWGMNRSSMFYNGMGSFDEEQH
jgi:hypothetical protein